MPHCCACYKEIYSSQLKTIGEQIVCSLSCVGLLKANEKDSCDYCKRPVWKDNYYKINDKLYCSDFCKELILEELKLPKDSDKINHFNDKSFTNINPINLKSTKQLREEVLKVYNDFQFDIIEDDSNEFEKINANININIIEDEIEKRLNEIRKNIFNKDELNEEKKNINSIEHNSSNNLNNININKYLLNNNDIDIDKPKYTSKNINHYITKEISKENDLTNDKNNENNNNIGKDKSYQITDYTLKKMYTIPNNINKKINDITNKNIIPDRFNLNKYESHYTYNRYKDGYNNKILSDNQILQTDFNFDNNNNNFSNNYINNINTNLISYNVNNRNRNLSNDIALNRNKNNNNPVKISKNNKVCKTCLGNLGSMKFLDRDGNNFCSDKCKTEFLNNKNK